MKKLFVILAVAGVMAACKNAKTEEAKTDSAAVKADTTAVKADTTAVKADTTAAKADSTKK